MNQLKSWGLDENQSRGIADKLFDDNGKMRGLNSYRKSEFDTFSTILRRMAEEELRSTPLNGGGATGNADGSGGARPSGGSSRQSNSTGGSRSTGTGVDQRTTTVKLDDGKNRMTAIIPTNDERKFLGMLGNARRAA